MAALAERFVERLRELLGLDLAGDLGRDLGAALGAAGLDFPDAGLDAGELAAALEEVAEAAGAE